MDANQLQELVINARLDHWPPHLGVRTEAEKVEYLAQQISEMVNTGDAEIAYLENRVELLEEQSTEFLTRIDKKDDQIEKLETKVDELTDENERLRGELQVLRSKSNEAQ